jgi:16S rRNA (cytidine1402-2'-O)-methyltransferase
MPRVLNGYGIVIVSTSGGVTTGKLAVENKMGGEILCELLNGKTVALVSDAGMPGISDPGLELVKLAIENEITVTALPGASAFVCALAASGLPTGRFCFEGFLPVNKRARKTRLESVKNETRTLIFYEAPHKLLNTLRDMRDFFGERKIVLAREISKKFEEFFRATLSEAINFYEKSPPRGEFVLVIEGAPEKSESDALKHEAALKLAAAGAEKLMNDGAKLREVAAIIAEKFSLKKNEAKAICMTFKNDNLKQN